MTKSPSDGDEIAAIASGSQEAFAAFVGRYQQGLRGFLRRTCGDWALADDLAQETFVTAWSRISGLRPGGSLRGWLFGIAYRKALAALRSNRRRTARDAVSTGAYSSLSDMTSFKTFITSLAGHVAAEAARGA